MEIEFTAQTFDDACKLRYTIAIGEVSDLLEPRNIVQIAYFGTFHRGTEDSNFVGLVTSFAESAWRADAVVLDLREFTYDWGDDLRPIFGRARIPKYVVVSDLCRSAVTSFIDEEMGDDATWWLFDSIEAAIDQCYTHFALEFEGCKTLGEYHDKKFASLPELDATDLGLDWTRHDSCQRLIEWASKHHLLDVREQVSSLKWILRGLDPHDHSD